MRSFLFFLVCLTLLFGVAETEAAQSERPGRSATALTKRSLAPVLLVHGGDTPEADQWYHTRMDSLFGVGNWDEYNLPEQGLPNPPELFLSVLGQYQGVLWHAGSSGLGLLDSASQVLADYILPNATGSAPGKLLLVVPPLSSGMGALAGRLGEEGLGVYPISAPVSSIRIPAGNVALALVSDLPDLVESTTILNCTGIQPASGSEVLYQLEYCARCYGSPRPPYDPVVAVRKPDRETSFYAQAITVTVPLHLYGSGAQALETLLEYHMGFVPTSALTAGAGLVQLSINNSGYVGNFFMSPESSSLVYPYPSYVEHLYHGGIWVGARRTDGSIGVSTSADDYGSLPEAEELQEFAPSENGFRLISNLPSSENYDPSAIAPWQMECAFHDYVQLESGIHDPLGVRVELRATSWSEYPINDGVVLDYSVINISGTDLRDVYFGFYNDTTVGNTELTSPYYPPSPSSPGWNWYDDMNGGWQPGDLPDDPNIWMMWEHDDDGDDGWATSWVGCRLLGSSHTMTPEPGVAPVSYNSWKFRRGPEQDDTYWDEDSQLMVPGRYQTMANGEFDVGETPDIDFSIASDWSGTLSTGPVATLAAGDTLRVTYAMVCGDGEWELMRNSRRFAELAANGWILDATPVTPELPTGVRLEAAVPNPFNPSTEISFHLDKAGWTRLEVHSIDGKLVAVLVDGMRSVGQHKVSWQGRDASGQAVASGMYLYRLTAPGGTRLVGHMTLVK